MGLQMLATQHSKGQWMGQAQTKIPVQMAGISSALSSLVSMVSSSSTTCEPLFLFFAPVFFWIDRWYLKPCVFYNNLLYIYRNISYSAKPHQSIVFWQTIKLTNVFKTWWTELMAIGSLNQLQNFPICFYSAKSSPVQLFTSRALPSLSVPLKNKQTNKEEHC